jgi:hypothetical protein
MLSACQKLMVSEKIGAARKAHYNGVSFLKLIVLPYFCGLIKNSESHNNFRINE